MACSRYFFQALGHPTISSRSLFVRGLQTTRGKSNISLKQEKSKDSTEIKKGMSSRDQFIQDIVSLDEVDTFGPDMKTDAESNAHVGSDPPRLDPPLAFNDPAYSGYILPFPDKFANGQTREIQPNPAIRFVRYENEFDYEQRVNSAKSFQDKEDEFALENAKVMTKMQSPQNQITTERIKVRRILSEGADPFLAEVRGTGKSTPVICEDVQSIRARRYEATKRGATVGFVPTMGALHQGHLDLMKAASAKCSEVWVSIYVNPTQFGANEDLSTYPSTWQADLDKIEELNDLLLFQGQNPITTIFRPRNAQVLYPYGVEGTSHVIINPELTQILEGSSRPTFFRGVTTIVMKLLNIVQPDKTFFGQKDIQQFAVIKRMINEFHLPVALECVPTTRELSGLAMSSRNAYLGQKRQRVAPLLYRMLSAAKKTFDSSSHTRKRSLLIDSAMKVYTAEIDQQQRNAVSNPQQAVQFKLDYLSLADPDTMQEIRDEVGPRGAVMSLAIIFQPLARESITSHEWLGINGDRTAVRLIDNELLGVD